VFKLADGLINRGHKLTLFVSRKEKIAQVHETNAQIIFAQSAAWLPHGSLGNLYSFISQLRDLPKSDVLIATYYPTAYVVCLARCLGKHSGRVVYFVQGNESLFCQGFFRPIKKMMANWSYRLPIRMVTNSKWTASEIHRVGGNKALVVSLGIDLEVFHPPVSGKDAEVEPALVMTIGRHQKIKGYHDFIAAMRIVKSALPNLRLLVVSQEDIAIPPDLDGNVVRPKSDQELVDFYHRAQLYVSSSWYEGFGLPGLEAMACGTPLVTTNSGGVMEYAKHGQNCLVCPARQPVALADAVISMLQDDIMRKRFSEKGIRTVTAFSWEKVTQKFESLLSIRGDDEDSFSSALP
jgi:glycosyltransferase involved in cell wall biosynthesis